jgi:hypothetical protein
VFRYQLGLQAVGLVHSATIKVADSAVLNDLVLTIANRACAGALVQLRAHGLFGRAIVVIQGHDESV